MSGPRSLASCCRIRRYLKLKPLKKAVRVAELARASIEVLVEMPSATCASANST
jgi:hypothetical protein